MIRDLPTYKGYTVDVRLREFRRVDPTGEEIPLGIEFIPFDSEQGQQLLEEMLRDEE